ncbi:MAG: hypothetical protein K1X94_21315 [Sandaracinaceae bacterium]|nr:hypothetical protein [Sandaracinaceae bacterium]
MAVAPLLVLGACDGGAGTDDAGPSSERDAFVAPGTDAFVAPGTDAYVTPGTDAPTTGGVTYYGNLRPVLAQHCASCHVEGGVAPFALTSYEQATSWGSRLVEVTRDRIMPPYLADNSGSCQTYRDARWLSDAELATFADWVAQGMQEGDPTTPEPMIVPPPVLTGAVSTLDIGVDYTPDSGRSDDYRCFIVDSPGGYVTGYDVHPGNRSIVHHVIVYEPTSDAEGDRARSLDAAEAGPGYTCFGSATVDAFPVVLWAPGGGATTFPRGTGVEIPTTRPLIVQIHYNVLGGTGSDRTRVDVQTDARAIPAYIVPIIHSGFAIPPRTESYSSTHSQSLSALGSISPRVYGAFPHMHTLGTSLSVSLVSGATEQCVIDVPRWDFNWQLAYWYETPFRVSSTDEMRITCEWSSMGRDTTTTWGEGTEDEMCLSFFYVSL